MRSGKGGAKNYSFRREIRASHVVFNKAKVLLRLMGIGGDYFGSSLARNSSLKCFDCAACSNPGDVFGKWPALTS